MVPGRYALVMAIVEEALAEKVTDAARLAGARAVTALRGRGRDLVRPRLFLGAPIEPGREILILVLDHDAVDRTMVAIIDAGEPDEPGRGLAFAVELSRVDGLAGHPPPPGASDEHRGA